MASRFGNRIEVEVVNWDKHQDDRTSLWFKIRNDIFLDEKFQTLSPLAKVVCLFVWSLRARDRHSTVTFTAAYCARMVNSRADRCQLAVNELVEKRILSSTSCTDDVPREDKKREDKIRKQSTTPSVSFDIESLYKIYPKKEGKTNGLKTLKKQIKTEAQFKDLSIAIENYKSKCEAEKTEPKFIKQFSTFANCWADYLEIPSPKKSKIHEPVNIEDFL